MESLRAQAIRHVRGFTIDVAVQAVSGTSLWLRLIGVPVCDDGQVVRRDGREADVTHLHA